MCVREGEGRKEEDGERGGEKKGRNGGENESCHNHA